MRGILKEYGVELSAAGLGIVGFLLLIGKVNILDLFKSGIFKFQNVIISSLHSLSNNLEKFSPTDLLGIVFILMALIFIFRRTQYRIARKLVWASNSCPVCGWDKRRVHRWPIDRIISALLGVPLHRYDCTNPSCNWTGLEYGKPHIKTTKKGDESLLNKQPV